MSQTRLDLTSLRNLRKKAAELENLKAQVGLFQDTAGRSAHTGRIQDNPSLGAIHEFGQGKLPQRSFLQMPLTLFLGKTLESQGANWFATLLKRGVRRTVALLGLVGEDIVQEAFSTGGFGSWREISPETAQRKGSAAILIETAQLRKAVSSRVV